MQNFASLSFRRARLVILAAALSLSGCVINSTHAEEPTNEQPEEKDKPKAKKKKPKKEAPAAEVEKEKKPKKEEKKDPEPVVEKPAKPEKAEPVAEKPAKPEKPAKAEPVAEKPAKPTKPEKPEPVAEKPAPQPEQSKIVVPVKVTLDSIAKQIDALVPTTDSKDWTQISKGDESPKADLKYELWRDPIEIELKGHTFHITVPVRYAATIRAQVKNPITKDWVWIAKSETWGTRQEPQKITASFEATLSVDDEWHIKSDMRLDKLQHGDAPSGSICKNIGIEVCVPKSSVAGEVREGIDKRLEPKLTKALKKLDAKIEKAFDLQKRAAAVWSALQAPQALPGTKDGAWLVVRPRAIGVGLPGLDGPNVRVDLAIEGRLTVEAGSKPKVKAEPLPKLSKVEGEAGFHVIAELRLPTDVLSSTLERELKGLSFDAKKQKISITRVQVSASADDKRPHRLTVKVAFGDKAEDELELHGDVAYDAAAQRLSIKDFDFAGSSKSLLTGKLAGFDANAIRKQVAAKARWDLGNEAEPLRKAIASALDASLKGQASVHGTLSQLDVQDFKIDEKSLTAKVIVGGQLEVEVIGR